MSKKKAINENQTLPVQSQFLLYQTEDGQTCIEVRLQDETVEVIHCHFRSMALLLW